MSYLTDSEYYENNGNAPKNENLGSYQYVAFNDLIKNFESAYSDEGSWIDNIPRHKVIFFMKQAIKELNFDALKEIKALELNVSDKLQYPLPSDYVNLVRISMYKNGELYPLQESRDLMTTKAYLQDNKYNILFDINGEALSPQYSELDRERITGIEKATYYNVGHPYHNSEGYYYDGSWYFGAVFNMDTKSANVNPVFEIDKKSGVINFNSDMSDELCVLEYISDGMEKGDEGSISVNKLFEKYVYAETYYQLADISPAVPDYVVRRALRKKSNLYRNAKVRIGFNPFMITQSLKGRNKQIKL